MFLLYEIAGQKDFPLLQKIINGGIASITGISIVFPLDLVKTRLQSQQIGPNGERMYKNLFDCFKKTYRAEGFRGMYSGSAINILLVTPEKAIKLAANDYFLHKLAPNQTKKPMGIQILSGGLAGAYQSLITTPMELLKIQLQNAGRINTQLIAEGKPPVKVTTMGVMKDMMKDRGFLGLYKGFAPCLQRDIWFSVAYFPIMAALNNIGPRRKDGEALFWWSFLAGVGAGAVSALLVTPFDVLKTRLQSLNKLTGEKQFSGMMDCFYKTLRHEGPTAFFKGGLCRMIVIAPMYGIVQAVYFLGIAEKILNLFQAPSVQ